MHTKPSALDTKTLVSCLLATAGGERNEQVDFLLYLAEVDAREAYREHSCGSLWDFCRREAHLRAGAAGRRIGAMRALRDFPALEAPLRDGRLCLTTVVTLRPVLTRENLDEMVGRAAYLSDDDTAYLVASLRPRQAPREGIRKLPGAAASVSTQAAVEADHASAPASSSAGPAALTLQPVQDAPALRPARRATLEPVSAEVRRQVWERDGGRCTYVGPDGHRCDSRWQLELDHVDSAKLGGHTTADDLRLRCKARRPQNSLHAEQTFGRAYMAKFRHARGETAAHEPGVVRIRFYPESLSLAIADSPVRDVGRPRHLSMCSRP